MKNALIYTVVFAAIQALVSMVVQGVWPLVMGKDTPMNATGMIIMMAAFSVITIARLDADAPLVRAVLVCTGCTGRPYPFYMASGADACSA